MHLPRPVVVAAAVPTYRLALHHRVPVAWARRILNASGAAARLPAGTVVRPVRLGARPADRVTVGATERPRAVLYLHGGGYTVGSPRLYRPLAAHLSRAAGAVVYTLGYRLAPEHPYPAALDDAVTAFGELLTATGLTAAQVAIAGDSAGGGLAVAAAVRLRAAGLTPAALGLLSPWTDPSDEQFTRTRDRVTNVAWGRVCAAGYRGDTDRTDPGYAPMHADLTGLPPMLIHYARAEMLRPQVLRFADRARAAGVPVTLVEHPVLWHSGHVLAGTLREASDAVADLGAFLRARLDAAAAPRAAQPARSGTG